MPALPSPLDPEPGRARLRHRRARSRSRYGSSTAWELLATYAESCDLDATEQGEGTYGSRRPRAGRSVGATREASRTSSPTPGPDAPERIDQEAYEKVLRASHRRRPPPKSWPRSGAAGAEVAAWLGSAEDDARRPAR